MVSGPTSQSSRTPRSRPYHRWDGLVSIIDAGLLGQLPIGIAPAAFEGVTARPWDILVAASLAPLFYEIYDRARLARTYAARRGSAPWEPSGADGRWRAWDCDTHGPPVEGHGR